ncbi:hypothetical protein PLICRDRAFT_104202 [Plicaturopsis crispa FD-325 SS-3]|nr:hypothetical protein PLICRDRAFT_104202 [Plicaturopsis crispa FD-325 SS-3]
MRQKSQTPDDEKLRTALENMRYKDCTQDDINFLITRIAGTLPGSPRLADKQFRNSAIITGINVHKDRINELGCERFAADTNQKLTHFYSKDELEDTNTVGSTKRRGRPKKKTAGVRHSNVIDENLQNIIWNLPPYCTKTIAGKLSLCMGMPVLIKHNDATELGITNGQEATVAGWTWSLGPHRKKVLETLFVRLDHPPKAVQIDGLPVNVVPMVPTTDSKVPCMLPNDTMITLSRSQVRVLPNFAMTDYASQGKTRIYNPVDLLNCRSHMSYYTALSRSASAAGTIIVQGFSRSVIQGGASGWLRQEFRELELLDDITQLRHNNLLDPSVDGHRRNTLLRQFQILKGTEYVPVNVHRSIKWTRERPMKMVDLVTDSPWQLIEPDSKKPKPQKSVVQYVKAKGSTATVHTTSNPDNAKKTNQTSAQPLSNAPVGIIWDAVDYSCAYDALYTILYNVWSTNIPKWHDIFSDLNDHIEVLSHAFQHVKEHKMSLEEARDVVRLRLANENPEEFPNARAGTSIGDLTVAMLMSDSVMSESKLICDTCGHEIDSGQNRMHYTTHIPGNANTRRLSDWLRKAMYAKSRQLCSLCASPMHRRTVFTSTPHLLAFNLYNCDTNPAKIIRVPTEDKEITLRLRGVIYHGDFHFTARIITRDGRLWYYDGATTGGTSLLEGFIDNISEHELRRCKGRRISMALYARK